MVSNRAKQFLQSLLTGLPDDVVFSDHTNESVSNSEDLSIRLTNAHRSTRTNKEQLYCNAGQPLFTTTVFILIDYGKLEVTAI